MKTLYIGLALAASMITAAFSYYISVSRHIEVKFRTVVTGYAGRISDLLIDR